MLFGSVSVLKPLEVIVTSEEGEEGRRRGGGGGGGGRNNYETLSHISLMHTVTVFLYLINVILLTVPVYIYITTL